MVCPLAKLLSMGFNQIVITKLQPTACELQLGPLSHGALASVDWLSAKKSTFSCRPRTTQETLVVSYANKVSKNGGVPIG